MSAGESAAPRAEEAAPLAGSPPSLSVVIPCRDAEATLGVQLAALATQRWEGEWEVIVADNGSTDGSRAVAESFHGRLPGLRVIDAGERPGPAHARNRGAAAASGEALLFCDADDEVAPGWLAALGWALARHDFVASRYEFAKLNPPRVARTRPESQSAGLNAYTYPPFLPHAGGGGLGVKAALHRAVGGFDETMPVLEDTDYCWRLQLAGTPLVYVPDALVHVRSRHDLGGMFRQNLVFGEGNVAIFKKYRPLGMPRLGPGPGLLRWAKLVASAPRLATAVGRAAWLSQLGWRLGRLQGCFKHRVAAL
jgi:glycosyltransferase involved in cell wall biosynthesis